MPITETSSKEKVELSPEDVQKLESAKKDWEKLLPAADIKAKYKIEVHFGHARTVLGLNACAVLIWESGKRFHGGGDEKMYWCGYKDCQKPIRSSGFAQYHVVCPSCNRECFLDQDSKKQHLDYLRLSGLTSKNLDKFPCIVGEKFMKVPAQRIAEYLSKVWQDLGGDADIYLKYHRNDIRFDMKDSEQKKNAPDILNKARDRRGMMIYPLKNIIKDLSAGADVTKRFLSMITA